MNATDKLLDAARLDQAQAYEAVARQVLGAYCGRKNLAMPAFPWTTADVLAVTGIDKAEIRALVTLQAIPEPDFIGENWAWSATRVHGLIRAWIAENQ